MRELPHLLIALLGLQLLPWTPFTSQLRKHEASLLQSVEARVIDFIPFQLPPSGIFGAISFGERSGKEA
jgi:hypothetical protein